jgi:hypothetical protein
MAFEQIPEALRESFEIHEWRHASAILMTDFPNEWADLCDVLPRFKLCKSYLTQGGGNKSLISKWFDDELNKTRGWTEKKFETSVLIDGALIESPTHSVDCFKNRVALEVE